jgi:hypothetical protein
MMFRNGPANPGQESAAERATRRPNSAPAYYLGHSARLWIATMRPRRAPLAAIGGRTQ